MAEVNDMNLTETFRTLYRRDPAAMSFCPYRICPLGAHIDHQHGKVTGFAIDRGITVAYEPTEDGTVEVTSLDFAGTKRFSLTEIPRTKQNDWADYLRGVTLCLGREYPLHTGLHAVLAGSLPIGGLSSSAAVILAYLTALCKVNDICLSDADKIRIARAAENEYVGVACGKLDQSCEVWCKKDRLLTLDTLDDTRETIPAHPAMKPYEIAIVFSGIERTLVGSKYNTRVDECRAAAYTLKAHAGMDYGNIGETHLREVPRNIFDRYGYLLPDAWKRRAEHWYGESDRVERGIAAWKRGDIDAFGKLVFASGKSSIENYEAGSPELIKLYEILTETDGIYGGRFSGAGFKGCALALIDPACRETVTETVKKRYLAAFPELEGKVSIHLCKTADGVSEEG